MSKSYQQLSFAPQWAKEKSTRFAYTLERSKLTGSHGQRPWFNSYSKLAVHFILLPVKPITASDL
jgi:hypothetical protein